MNEKELKQKQDKFEEIMNKLGIYNIKDVEFKNEKQEKFEIWIIR